MHGGLSMAVPGRDPVQRHPTAARDSLTEFVLQPGPEDAAVQCRITRNSLGLDKGGVFSKMKIISADKEKLPCEPVSTVFSFFKVYNCTSTSFVICL